jgi:hypothetical protein
MHVYALLFFLLFAGDVVMIETHKHAPVVKTGITLSAPKRRWRGVTDASRKAMRNIENLRTGVMNERHPRSYAYTHLHRSRYCVCDAIAVLFYVTRF